jgi:NADPH2:quinone reductase
MVGAFAEQVAVPAASVVPVPADVDLVSAAALRVTYLTAYHSLVSVADVKPGEWVAVLGGSGGVGSAALDVAAHLGCPTVAVVSSPERVAICLGRGAQVALTYTEGDLKLRLREVSGDGLDVVVDPVGGTYAQAVLRAMRWGGRYVTVGYASGQIPSVPLNLVLLKGVTIKGFEMRTFAQHAPAAARTGDAALMAMVAGGLRPHVSAVFPLSRAPEALLAVAERRTTGKVVLTTGAG